MCWISSFSDTICVCVGDVNCDRFAIRKEFLIFLASCSSFRGSAKLLLLCRFDREGAFWE